MHRNSVYLLVFFAATLLVLGLVMLSSTSAFAQDSHGDPSYFVKRQIFWAAIGVVLCVGAALVDYHFWQRTWWIWFAVAFVFLALCFVPHVGMRINGAARWVNLRVLTFQPSEIGKIAAIAFLAHWFSRHAEETGRLVKGFLVPGLCVGALMALIVFEVDLGTTVLVGATMFAMMFVAGTRLRYLMPVASGGIASVLFAAFHMKERIGRLLAFVDLEKYKESGGMQQWQALIAFGSGGVEGLGLGNGRQKMLYVPFAHTDFILPMIGEELGLRATLLIVFCFLMIVLCGVLIAVHSRDKFGMLFGFGIVMMISLQAAVNIGVTTALLPNKGLPLPFISYGGSNLAFCLLGIGILINIYWQ